MADERLIPAGIRDANTLALNDLIDRMGTVDLTPLLVYIIDDVTASALPHLLEQFHVAGLEGGRLAENDTNRRALLKRAIALHRLKGTPAGLKMALASLGFGAEDDADGTVVVGDHYVFTEYNGEPYYVITSSEDRPYLDKIQIIERSGDIRYDGAVSYDGLRHYGGTGGWAEYILTVGRPVTNDQVALIREMCKEYAPARCHLAAINYTRASLRYNGGQCFDGTYNYGTA